LRKATISFAMSVRPATNGRIFMKVDIWGVSNVGRKGSCFIKIWPKWRVLNMQQTDARTVMITSRSVLLRMRNVLGRSCREIKTHFLCSVIFFIENRPVWLNTSGCAKSLITKIIKQFTSGTSYLMNGTLHVSVRTGP
jgi:hypothetical protein